MADWQQKRFWTQVEIAQQELGYTVLLDGRLVKTPAKTLLALPTKALAEAVAAEWRAQVETVRPETMPYTRRANAALDKVTRQLDSGIQSLQVLDLDRRVDVVEFRFFQPEGGDGVSENAALFDETKFGAGGKLFFKNAPDFEDPKDFDQDNQYELVVEVRKRCWCQVCLLLTSKYETAEGNCIANGN